jgi:hypothetical protein
MLLVLVPTLYLQPQGNRRRGGAAAACGHTAEQGPHLRVVLVGDALVGAGEGLPRQLVGPVVSQPQRVQPRQRLLRVKEVNYLH